MNDEHLMAYTAQIETALGEAYAAVEQANSYIRNHEDGPLTMRAVLRSIKDRLIDVESESRCMRQDYKSLIAMLVRVIEQRDEAIRQCSTALRELEIMREAEQDREG